MSLASEIQKWFAQKGSYLQGVNLYRRCGGPYPNRTFEGYEDAPYVPDETENLLRSALLAYLELHQEPLQDGAGEEEDVPLNDSDEVFSTNKIKKPYRPKTEQEPAEIQRLRLEARLLHKKHALLHARLMDEELEKNRLSLIREMMEEVIPALDGIYDDIREWQSTGELPKAGERNADVVAETVQKMLRRDSLKSRISRLKSMLKKKLPDAERMNYEKELLEKEVEKKGIEEELGLI